MATHTDQVNKLGDGFKLLDFIVHIAYIIQSTLLAQLLWDVLDVDHLISSATFCLF